MITIPSPADDDTLEYILIEPDSAEDLPGGDAEQLPEGGIEVSVDDIVIEDDEWAPDEILRPGQVTVFDREAIEASGAATVADVIDSAPGVVVSRQGGVLEPQRVSIRGGEFEHALVLVNGEKTGSLWSGITDLSAIPLDSVDRIEVIRGAASALYGAGAFSGVVNIITGEDAGSVQSTEFEYGISSFNTHSLSAGISGTLSGDAGVNGFLDAGGLYTDGDYEYSTPDGIVQRLNNDGYAVNSSAGIEWDPPDAGFDMSLSGALYLSEKGTPGIMEFLTPEAGIRNSRWSSAVSFNTDSSASGEFTAKLGISGMLSTYSNPEEELEDTNDNLEAELRAGWLMPFQAGDILFELQASGGYVFDSLYSTALTDSSGASVDGTAFQHSADLRLNCGIEWGSFDFTPAAALDWISYQYPAAAAADDLSFTWSAAAGWSPFRTDYSEGPLYFKFNTGTARRNPSFRDLFWPSGALASGNPDLLPEDSFSLDGGIYLTLEAPALSFELVYFTSWAENLIQWLPSAGGVWRPANISSALNSGFEFSAGWNEEGVFDLFDLEIKAVYNYLSSIDNAPDSVNYGLQLAYRPEHTASVTLTVFQKDIFSAGAEISYIGYRFTNNADTKYLDDALLLSANLMLEFCSWFDMSVTADNITGVQYVDRLGYPVPGFKWTVKGRLSL